MFAAAVAGLAAAAPLAHANQYRAYVCTDPKGGVIAEDTSVTSALAFQDFSGVIDTCPSGGPVYMFMGREPASAPYSQGELARFMVTSPVPIWGAYVTHTLTMTDDPRDNQGTPEYVAQARTGRDGTVTALLSHCIGRCTIGDDRLGNDPQNTSYWKLPDTRARFLEFSLRCGGVPWGQCATGGGPRAGARFFRVELVLDDASGPGLFGKTGTFDTGVEIRRGDLSLNFTATESSGGSGILDVLTLVDGKVTERVVPNSNGGKCVDAGFRDEPDYRVIQPCPSQANVNLTIDTNKITDGPHTVSVMVRDAALNETRVAEHGFTVDNIPPPANVEPPTITKVDLNARPKDELRPADTLAAANGKWTGKGIVFTYEWQRSAEGGGWTPIANGSKANYIVSEDDVGRALRVVVTAANVEGATSKPSSPTVIVKTGAVAGPTGESTPPTNFSETVGGDPGTPQLVVDREQRTVEVNYGAKIVVTGRLVDADGQPIANATVDVFEQLVLIAAPWSKIDSVVTDSQGGYVFRPKTTASRRLRFAFADRRDAANYRATREVLVSVRAGMTISAKRKVVSPRGTIRLRGRITVENLPKTGTWVEVQVLDAGAWRTVATRKTSSKGLWTFKHRLRQSSGVSFRFRSRLRVVGDVASSEATSPSLKVRVR